MRFAGSGSGGTDEIVALLLLSAELICNTKACTSGGCVSPAITTLAPRFVFKSSTTASIHSSLVIFVVGRALIPSFDAIVCASDKMFVAATAIRWSALDPVIVGVDSAA